MPQTLFLKHTHTHIMKIECIGTRLVKPSISSDVPPPLVHLSTADLMHRLTHVRVLFAYHAPAPPTSALETGLSQILCDYREWAGRLTIDAPTGRPAIELNDEGALLVEAEAHGNLQDMWPFNPSPLLLELTPMHKLQPQELLLIQVTRFACGGMVLGIAWHHQVADAGGAINFLEAWGMAVKGKPIAYACVHDRGDLMAANRIGEEPVLDRMKFQPCRPKISDCPESILTKRLNFSVELLKRIKGEAGAGYSTFVCLAAHLWKCITKARGLETGNSSFTFPVNARKRLEPPLPKGYLGNAICSPWVHVKIEDLVNKPLSFAASLIQVAITEVNNEYVYSLLDSVELERKINPPAVLPQGQGPAPKLANTPNLLMVSWVNFGMYSLDFGWGTPVFAGVPVVPPLEGLLSVFDSHMKDGSIDVIVALFATHMQKLELIYSTLDG